MTNRVCSVVDCGRPFLARGWCSMHYARWKDHGDPMYQRSRRVCSVAGCGRTHEAKGFCPRHYAKWVRYGDPLQERPPKPKCSTPGCDGGAVGMGLCEHHYRRWRSESAVSGFCSVVGCDGAVLARGWCATHYERWKAYGHHLVSKPPRGLRCQVCDDEELADLAVTLVAASGGRPVSELARDLGVSSYVARKHLTEHADNPEWHAKRAAWWSGVASELRANPGA